jgi:hypothetical protein
VGRTYNFLTSTLLLHIRVSTKFVVRKFARTYNEFYLKHLTGRANLRKTNSGRCWKRAYDGGLYCTISTVVTNTTTTECARYCDYHPPSYWEVARVKFGSHPFNLMQVFRICSTLTNRICPQISIKIGNFIFHTDSFSDTLITTYRTEDWHSRISAISHCKKHNKLVQTQCKTNFSLLQNAWNDSGVDPGFYSMGTRFYPGAWRWPLASYCRAKNEWSCNLYSPYTSAWCPHGHPYLCL